MIFFKMGANIRFISVNKKCLLKNIHCYFNTD